MQEPHALKHRTLMIALLMICFHDHLEALPSDRLKEIRIAPAAGAALPMDLPLVDEEGRRTRLRALTSERPALLVFYYDGCPMLCTEVLHAMVRSLIEVPQTPGSDFEVVAVSIDPTDTPRQAAARKSSILLRYGREGAERGFHFVTADAATIGALTTAAGFHYARDAVSGQYVHAAGIYVITPQGRVSRCFLGIDERPQDLRLSLVEAADDRIGTLVERLQLLCYQYDPATGRYGVWILGVVRLLSIATFVALAVFVLRAIRQERRHHA